MIKFCYSDRQDLLASAYYFNNAQLLNRLLNEHVSLYDLRTTRKFNLMFGYNFYKKHILRVLKYWQETNTNLVPINFTKFQKDIADMKNYRHITRLIKTPVILYGSCAQVWLKNREKRPYKSYFVPIMSPWGKMKLAPAIDYELEK